MAWATLEACIRQGRAQKKVAGLLPASAPRGVAANPLSELRRYESEAWTSRPTLQIQQASSAAVATFALFAPLPELTRLL